MSTSLKDLLEARFGAELPVPDALERDAVLTQMVGHRSHRRFTRDAVEPELVRTLLACAFSAPAKSDLQQACVVNLERAERRAEVAALLSDSPWVAQAPVLLVWCGDNRRIRRICEQRGKPFANDHLDSFFNAAVDCALVMMNFIRALEATGLGCCPLSAIRNHASRVSELLSLPDHVFPVAGMVLGWPSEDRKITPRLPLECFIHDDRYDDGELGAWLDEYDRRRHAVLPLDASKQRQPERYEPADFYAWSEDKARQVSVRERGDFGAFARDKGFELD